MSRSMISLSLEGDSDKTMNIFRGIILAAIITLGSLDIPAQRYRKRLDRDRMNVLDFIAQFCQHIPEANQQMVRYYGVYSNRSRGGRKTGEVPAPP